MPDKPKFIHSFSLNFTYESDLEGEDGIEEEIVRKEALEHLVTMLTAGVPGKFYTVEWWDTDYNEEDSPLRIEPPPELKDTPD